jgi:DNA-binding IclR family transcriptional regulator
VAGSKSGADSARRAIDLLFAFEQKSVASVRELSEAVDMPVPSAHRYVAMLRDMGLVEEADHGRYRLTMRVLALGQAARRATSLIEMIQPFMQELSDETNETVLFVQPVQGRPVCTHRIEARRTLRLSFEVGQYMPPLRGASAHLVVGAMPERERRAYVEDALARGEIPPVGGVEGFLTDAARDAARGWAVSREEIDEGVWAPAAAILADGGFVGTLSVPCPEFRIDDKRAEAILESVRDMADRIGKALGS